MSDVLVLDKKGQPIYIERWQEVVRLWVLGSVDIIAEDDKKILHSHGFEMGMPRVVRLRNWVHSLKRDRIPLSRRNLIIRDSIVIDGKPTVVCQYCGKPLTTETYSVDHILPRSRGGKTVWTNVVAACKDCNFPKANKTPEEAGMKLLKRPKEPSVEDPRFTFRLHIRNPHPSWSPWLYWNIELDE